MQTLRCAAVACSWIQWACLSAAIGVIATPDAAHAQQLLPPSFSSTAPTSAAVGTAYSYPVTVADLDLLDTITITAPTLPAWLTLVDNGDRSATLSGVPGPANAGANAVVLEATDGVNAVQQAFTITVDVDGTPVAAPDAYTTTEGDRLDVNQQGGVLANDTDPNGDPLTAVLVTNVANGTLDLGPDGRIRYDPAPTFNGTDSFTYSASDGGATSAPVTVTITVTGENDAPDAQDDSYSTAEDTQLTIAAAQGVLANDTDEDGNPLTAALTRDVEHGTVALAADGSFIYTPTPNYSGDDEFRYRASDGTAQSNEARVRITVSTGNDLPVAVADSYSTSEDTPLNVGVPNGVLSNDTDGDSDSLTAIVVANVTSGTLTLNSNGSFSYTPNAGFSGTDTFSYQANDGTGASNTAAVTISVSAGNDAPTAAADAYTTNEDTPLTVPAAGVLANDTDPDGDALTAALVGNATSGTVALNGNGGFTYTPAANFNGTATFTYQARDGNASSATTTVTITVAAVNDVPFITSAPATTVSEGVTYTYTLTATDADGTPLTFAAPALAAWLVFTPPATITGTPDQDDVGVHPVTMTASDGVAAAVAQTFQITVALVDNLPVIAAIPNQTATEGVPFTLDLKPFVTDPDTPAASIVYTATGALPPGVTLSSAGVVSGTVAPGAYIVRFTARDATGGAPGQFNLTSLAAGRADLAVALSATPNPVGVNAVATWTLAITNNAPTVGVDALSLDATFTGDVPFRFDPPATPGCTMTATGNESHLVCALGALAGGASTSVALTGSGGFPGDVFADAVVAIVDGATIDETPANDRASGSLSVAQSVTTTPAQVISGLAARSAAAGDLNGDGFDDLAIATGGPQGTIALLNVVDAANANKRALSTAPTALGGEALGTDVALADLDRDEDLEIVVAAAVGAPNRVFRNSGGAFTSAAIGAASEDSRAVAIGDLNGDGFPDLVFANNVANAVYLNQGAGATFARTAFGSGDGRDVAVVDLFGDALPEVVIANGTGDAAIYRNSGGSLLLELTLATGVTTSVAAADLNNDSRADLVFSRSGSGVAVPPTNLVYLNTSTTSGAFFLADQLGAAATLDVLLDDFDLDDDTDVFAVNRNGDQIYTNVGTASGTFALHPQQLQNADAQMATAGRFSVDERIDVAVIAGGGATVFFNDGAGNLGQGDVAGPTIQLRGEPTVRLTVGETYTDAGATATDTADGDVSSRITVTNPVNTAVIGNYTVSYAATDLSGNSAAPATRTVSVTATENSEGGGGGALGVEMLFLLLAAAVAQAARRGRLRDSDARIRSNARIILSGRPVGKDVGR
jgi:VCBS repeat-containing protein